MNTTNLKMPVSESGARTIMGFNFFGIIEAIRHFSVVPTEGQIDFLLTIPFSEETLRACKDTHVLVALFPLTILDIRGHVRSRFSVSIFYNRDRYDHHTFARDAAQLGWYLIRKGSVPGSERKAWKEQLRVIPRQESVVKSVVVVYATVGHFLNTGERLFEKIYVRCDDVSSGFGNHVLVGLFAAPGFDIAMWGDGYCFEWMGLASVRKHDVVA